MGIFPVMRTDFEPKIVEEKSRASNLGYTNLWNVIIINKEYDRDEIRYRKPIIS